MRADGPSSRGLRLPIRESFRVRTLIDSVVVSAVVRRRSLEAGWPAVLAQALGVVAGELSSNQVRHADGGNLDVSISEHLATLVASDFGPGILCIETASLDHYSQGRRIGLDDEVCGLGCGLGAVHRLMDEVRAEQPPGGGLRIWATKRRPA